MQLSHSHLLRYCIALCDTAGDVSFTAPMEAIPLIAIRVISQSGHEVVVSVIPTKAGNASSKCKNKSEDYTTHCTEYRYYHCCTYVPLKTSTC